MKLLILHHCPLLKAVIIGWIALTANPRALGMYSGTSSLLDTLAHLITTDAQNAEAKAATWDKINREVLSPLLAQDGVTDQVAIEKLLGNLVAFTKLADFQVRALLWEDSHPRGTSFILRRLITPHLADPHVAILYIQFLGNVAGSIEFRSRKLSVLEELERTEQLWNHAENQELIAHLIWCFVQIATNASTETSIKTWKVFKRPCFNQAL